MCRVFTIRITNPITINGLKDIDIHSIMITNNFFCDDFYTPADGGVNCDNDGESSSVSSSDGSSDDGANPKEKTNSKFNSKSNRLFQYNHAEICTYCRGWMEYAPRNTYTEQFERVLMLLNQDEEVKQRIVEDCQTDGCFLHIEIKYENYYAKYPYDDVLEIELSDILMNMDDVDITPFERLIKAQQNRTRSYVTEMKGKMKITDNEKSKSSNEINGDTIVNKCVLQ
jgi:hypothetical protein